MNYPAVWYEKLKNDTETYEQIILGNRDYRWNHTHRDTHRELHYQDDSNKDKIMPDF